MRGILAVIFVLLLILSACNSSPSPEPEVTPSPTVSSSPTPAPTPTPTPTPTPDPLTVNPLTGLPVEDAGQLVKRPVAIMMNNLKKALPMSGISEADVIYETLAEGGITRMLALFQDATKLGKTGTIRSTRTYYLELALGHDSLLFHAGASYLAYDEIPKWKVDNFDGVRGSYANLYYRDKDRVKSAGLEHSMYTDGARIAEAIEKFKGRRDTREDFRLNWVFEDNPVMTNSQNAETVVVNFTKSSSSKFIYDTDKKVYFFEEYGAKFMDEANNTQVSVTNLLVLYTDVALIKGDKDGRLTTRLTGTGEGVFATGGRLIPIKWSKASRDEPFVFTLPDGSAMVFARGKSYICIVPMEGTVINS